jgi:hypothetical protein
MKKNERLSGVVLGPALADSARKICNSKGSYPTITCCGVWLIKCHQGSKTKKINMSGLEEVDIYYLF